MPAPAFSVVIPVHNGEPYIAAALESVLAQTYPHFNIFVLENGSEDNTLAMVNAHPDPRIQIVPSEQLLGIEDNWARILTLDLNEYMTILAHDDLLYPDFLQEIVRLIEVEPQATFYHTRFHFIAPDGKVLRSSLPAPLRETGDEFLERAHRLLEECSGSGWVARSADYQQVGGLPPFHHLLFSDMFCWYALTRLAYKVCSPQCLYAFRMHSDSATKISTILDFHTAGQQYVKALAPFQTPEAQPLARRFVLTHIQWSYRRFLHTLIKAHEPRTLGEIDQLKATAAAQHLALDTPSLRWYEWLARLPWRLPRMVLFRMTNVGAKVRARLANMGTH